MSYVSLLKNIPEILSQPTGIAAIASLGIHGAIALIVPLMPVESEPSKISAAPRSVGILELGQADQQRLPENPNSLTSQVALQPQLPLQPELPLQPQLPQNLDVSRTVLPPLPSSIYSQSALPPINITPNYPTSSYRNVPLPQRQPTPLLEPEQITPRKTIGFAPSGFNAANQKFTRPTRVFNHSEVKLAVQPVPIDRLPRVTPSAIPGNLPNIPPVTTGTGNNAATINPDQTALIARLQKTRASQESEQQKNPTIANQLPAKTVNDQQGLIAKLNSYDKLREEIQQQYPNSQQKTVIRATIPANQPNIEGTVSGFLVVDPEGKVLDIKFQDKSVDRELQSKAREYFSTRSPQGGQQISSYPFTLRFHNSASTAETPPEQTSAVVVKPVPELRMPNEQPTPDLTTKPSTTSAGDNNSLSSTLESSQKLIQQLRQLRDERSE